MRLKRVLAIATTILNSLTPILLPSIRDRSLQAVSDGKLSIQVGPINILDFGADPTGTIDSTSAIQAALTRAESNVRSGKIYIPKGTYRISSSLHMYHSTSIVGDGAEVSIIQPTSALTSSCLFVGVEGATPRPIAGVIEGIGLDGSRTTSNDAFGFNVWASGIQIRNCSTTGFYYGLYARRAWTTRISNCAFASARSLNVFLDKECHNVSIRDSRIVYSAGAGIRVSSSNGVTIDGCDIERNKGNGVEHDANNGVASRNFTIINSYFEANGSNALGGSGSDISLMEAFRTDCYAASVINCYFEPVRAAKINVDHRTGPVCLINCDTASLVVAHGASLITDLSGSNDFGFGATGVPSNPVAGNTYSTLGKTVTESINGISVGTSPTRLTKNGASGGMAFLTCTRSGHAYNAVVLWTRDQSATVVGSSGSLNGAKPFFTVGNPHNGCLYMALSNVSGGKAVVSGIAITTK